MPEEAEQESLFPVPVGGDEDLEAVAADTESEDDTDETDEVAAGTPAEAGLTEEITEEAREVAIGVLGCWLVGPHDLSFKGSPRTIRTA